MESMVKAAVTIMQFTPLIRAAALEEQFSLHSSSEYEERRSLEVRAQ
mgnify:CR=1 FL=1